MSASTGFYAANSSLLFFIAMASSFTSSLTLGICNLLLITAGLLFAYFDWSAARRREFLYIYFSEDKPGASYFAAARRRRAQYTRLLSAFIILLVTEFLALVQVSSAQNTELSTQQALMWVQALRMVAPLLGAAFLFDIESPRRHIHDILVALFVGLWGIFLSLVEIGAFGTDRQTALTVAWVARTIQISASAFLLFVLWKRTRPTSAGMLEINRPLLTIAFASWLIGPLVAALFRSGTALAFEQLSSALAYGLLAIRVGRGMLAEYENVESSRHRMGRERQMILSYLQRVGTAFTSAIEMKKVLQIVLESGLETTEASAGAIYLYRPETGKLEPSVVLNFFPPMHVDTPAAQSPDRTEELEDEMKHQAFRLGEGIIGEVAQQGRAQIIDDVRAAGIMLGTTTDFMRNRSMLAVPLRIRDEPLGVMVVLNKQRGSFGQDDQFLLQALADQGALSISNAMLTIEVGKQERLRRELQIARDIQRMLLPDKCPKIAGFTLAARGSSAYEVGGDYYDFFQVDDDHFGVVVADVSGKGVPAALTVAMMRSVFRTQSRGNRDVRDVLSQVNRFMAQDLRRSDFITCIYGILEVSTRRFTWARAGHEPLLLAHADGEIEVLRPAGFALGVIESPQFDELLEIETLQLKEGDELLLFTDGLTEAMNESGEEFGLPRILSAMREDGAKLSTREPGSAEISSTETLPLAMCCLDDAVEEHVGDEPQSDDLTMVYLAAK